MISVITFGFLSINLWYLATIIRSGRWLTQARKKDHYRAPSQKRIAILIPIYDEIKIIKETVDYYAHIASQLRVRIVFVTTGREGNTSNNPSLALIEKLTEQLEGVSVMHYPYSTGAKAAQLNWAMNKLGTVEQDYFAIFDADSRPNIEGIQYVLRSATSPEVFQMPATHLPHSSNSLASLALSAFQSRWSLCFEIPKWRAWQYGKGGGRIMYLVGHGLFVKPDIRFAENTLTEDLELGYRLSAKATSFALVPYFDYGSVPKSLITAVMQSSRWYYGEFFLPKFFLKTVGLHQQPLRYTLWFIIRYFQIVLWMLGPIFVLFASTGSMGNAVLLTINLVSILIYCFLLNLLTCSYLGLSFRSLLLMPVKSIVNCLGPLLCVLFIILDIFGLRKNTFAKTTR